MSELEERGLTWHEAKDTAQKKPQILHRAWLQNTLFSQIKIDAIKLLATKTLNLF